jgi:hypothetical protein
MPEANSAPVAAAIVVRLMSLMTVARLMNRIDVPDCIVSPVECKAVFYFY